MPDYITKNEIWLIGTGYMAIEYAKVLRDLPISFQVIGNTEKSVASFKEKTGIEAVSGGIDKWLATCDYLPRAAINVVNVEKLAEITKKTINFGVPKILVEKPAGLNGEQIASLSETAKEKNALVYVAYNRRFYASVLKALELIKTDEGVTSFNFEFTEWPHKIEGQNIPNIVKQEWFLANSSHVVDMAFFIGGWPRSFSSYVAGSLPWHKAASVFAGAGISDKNALFCYQANWDAPGRWSVEVLTRKRRFIFRPMEQLHVQKIGSVAIEKMDIDDSLDIKYKPGLYRQVEAFLFGKLESSLLPLEEQYFHVKHTYKHMRTPEQ